MLSTRTRCEGTEKEDQRPHFFLLCRNLEKPTLHPNARLRTACATPHPPPRGESRHGITTRYSVSARLRATGASKAAHTPHVSSHDVSFATLLRTYLTTTRRYLFFSSLGVWTVLFCDTRHLRHLHRHVPLFPYYLRTPNLELSSTRATIGGLESDDAMQRCRCS